MSRVWGKRCCSGGGDWCCFLGLRVPGGAGLRGDFAERMVGEEMGRL